MPEVRENVVMTPKCKTSNSTTLIIERKPIAEANNATSPDSAENKKVHIAGGDHTGIVINKESINNDNEDILPAQVALEFRVFLVNAHNDKHTKEARKLRFWFKPSLPEYEHASVAQSFFRELVSPNEFPRDYVGYIKKIMKLMQHNYDMLKKLEVELQQLGEVIEAPTRPLSGDESCFGKVIELNEERVLQLIESAFPNPVTVEEIARENNWPENDVANILIQLTERGVVKSLENGVAFTRAQHAEEEVTVVKQMPTMVSAKQPTIAIITGQYCEKLAVDAMIENKETFVRYTTVGTVTVIDEGGNKNVVRQTRFGESNVYTLGNIGAHRVVCTKLPTVGHSREAMIAAGNTTTRLLGTFQRVDHVLLVGVAGGVPHFTDYSKHVRLGDVVVSVARPEQKHVYFYCQNTETKSSKGENGVCFDLKPYVPSNAGLQAIAQNLKSAFDNDANNEPPWMKYLNEALQSFEERNEETDFRAPPAESDKLYMSIGEQDVIEVAHPTPTHSAVKRFEGRPRIHLAPIASGRRVTCHDQLRQLLSSQTGALAFDAEYDTVIESIIGNCRDSFMCIRGIADYKDGSRRREWQPYASLVAASVMKAIVCGMEAPTNV